MKRIALVTGIVFFLMAVTGCGTLPQQTSSLHKLHPNVPLKYSSLPKPNPNQPWSLKSGILAYAAPGGVEIVNLTTPSIGHLVRLAGFVANVQVSSDGTVGIVVGDERVFYRDGKSTALSTPNSNGQILWTPDGSLAAWSSSIGVVLYSPIKDLATVIPGSYSTPQWASNSQVDYVSPKGAIASYDVQSKAVTTLETSIPAYAIEMVGGGRVFFDQGMPGTQPSLPRCMVLQADGKVTQIGSKNAIACGPVGLFGNQVLTTNNLAFGVGSGPAVTQLTDLTSGETQWSVTGQVSQSQMMDGLIVLNAPLENTTRDQLQFRERATGTLVARYDLLGPEWQGEKSAIWYFSALSSKGVMLNELTTNGGNIETKIVLAWH